jgi:hypothetical protein
MVLDADWDFDLEDSWNYKWNSNSYSSKRGYSELQGTVHRLPPPSFPGSGLHTTLGNTNSSSGFYSETLITRNMLRRKKMFLDDYTCVLCNTGSEESYFHLFFGMSL